MVTQIVRYGFNPAQTLFRKVEFDFIFVKALRPFHLKAINLHVLFHLTVADGVR